MAVALLDGKVTLHSFEAKRLADPVVHELMQKVRVAPLAECSGLYPETMPTRITVRTKAGHSYVEQVDHPLGHPRHPMSDREIEAKFRRLAMGKLGRARVSQVTDLVWKLEQLKDLNRLMPLLRARHG